MIQTVLHISDTTAKLLNPNIGIGSNYNGRILLSVLNADAVRRTLYGATKEHDIAFCHIEMDMDTLSNCSQGYRIHGNPDLGQWDSHYKII